MRLNGWQRLWLLVTVLWALVVGVFVVILQSNRNEAVPLLNAIGFWVLFWSMPAAAVYALGLGIAWVRSGFRPDSK